jgi:hypothetical protein
MLEVRGRSGRRRLVALALGLASLGAPAAALAQEGGQVEAGFAIEANLIARVFTIGVTGGGGATLSAPLLGPGLILGYKTGRILIGLGLEFSNNTQSTSTGVGANIVTTTTSDSNFLIGPDFQFAIVRSADQRVELIGDAALHFGHQFHEVTISPSPPPGPGGPTDSNFILSYRIGPGLRFWAHRHFALQTVTGFAGQAYFDLPVNPPAQGNNSQHSIYVSIGALGVF